MKGKTMTTAPKFPLPRGQFYGWQHNSVPDAGLTQWQKQMIARGYDLEATGRYDQATRDVAELFQFTVDLHPDTKIGPATWYAAWGAPLDL
jgi:hypothetical protein